jgi:hypothetical protein
MLQEKVQAMEVEREDERQRWVAMEAKAEHDR